MPLHSSNKGVIVPAKLIVSMKQRAAYHERVSHHASEPMASEHKKTAATLEQALALFSPTNKDPFLFT